MTYRDLDISLIDQLPAWYRDILDYQAVCGTEQTELDSLADAINAISDNMFFQTMDETAVSMWEQIFRIVAAPSVETVSFRRARLINRISTKPPFSLGFLEQKLDELIGIGLWSVTVDYPNYTMYIESSAENQGYAAELAITIGKIKPAHIIYVNEPTIRTPLVLSETVDAFIRRWNYTLGTWTLSGAPFVTSYGGGVVKMAGTPSMQDRLLSGVAQFISVDVAQARINGSTTVTAIAKSVANNTLTVSYTVTEAMASEITTVELLDSDGNTLTASTVYVPVGADGVLLQHKIPVKEGV